MKQRWLVVPTALLFACGDPVADGDYLGEALFEIHGRIEGDAGTSTIRHPYLGVLWMELVVDPADYGSPQTVTTLAPIENVRFPSSFSAKFFEPPPARIHFPMAGSQVAVGVPIVLDDVDGDGSFRTDPVLGILPPDVMLGASETLVLHVRAAASAPCQELAFGRTVEPGFHLVELRSCGVAMPVLPPGMPLRVQLFPPAPLPPESGGENETCIQPPSCEEDPTQPACVWLEITESCIERECARERERAASCTYVACQLDPDDPDCCEKALDDEIDCIIRHCTIETLCAP